MKSVRSCAVLFTALAWIAPANLASAGGTVGNGGDLVRCTHSSQSSFDGLFSLDYLLTYHVSSRNSDIVPVSDWRDSLRRIRRGIESKVPEYLESFDEFTGLILNSDVVLPRFWEEAAFGLEDLKDEKIVSAVPENCRVADSIRILQAVVRQNPDFSGTSRYRLIYKFDPKVFGLAAENPLQLSFLLVHEWLWDLSSNVDRNRRLNRLFHSSELDTLGASAFRSKLKALGLEIPTAVAPAVFHYDHCLPSPAYVSGLLKHLKGDGSTPLATSFDLSMRVRFCPANGCDLGGIFGSYAEKLPVEKSVTIEPRYAGGDPLVVFESRFHDSAPRIRVECALDRESARLSCSPVIGSFWLSSYPQDFQGSIGQGGCIALSGTLADNSRIQQMVFSARVDQAPH